MNKKKLAIISSMSALVLFTGILTVMNNDSSTKSNEIPVSVAKPVKTDEPKVISKSAESVITPNASKKSSETPTPSPTVYFSANSDQYPGSGTFNLPSFTTDFDWSATFDYTCDTGQVFGVINLGSQNIIMNRTGTFGSFSSRAGQIKVVVPADQTCTWSVSVS